MKPSILLSVALLIGAAPVAQASNTMWFKDVRPSHGHVRSAAVRHADGRACGASASLVVPKNVKKFEGCMAAHGWRLGGIYAERAKTVRPSASEDDTSGYDAAAAAQAAEEADDDARRNDESRAQTQQQIDDMNNTQEMVNNQQMLDDQQNMQNAINSAAQ